MALVMISSKVKMWKNDGTPAAGWRIWTYEAGTTTPKTSWSDEAETVANANPVVLDSRGEAIIRLKGSYKIKLVDDSSPEVEIWTVDNQTQYNQRDWSGLTATIAELNATNTSTLTKTADYPITITDRGKTIAVDATAATPTTVTLLNATTATNGYQITIKKIDKTNNVVNIDPDTAQKVDGLDPFVLYDYNDFIKILSDGSNWHLIAGKIRGSAITTTTTPLAIDLGDEAKTYLIDASSAAFTVNLPAINTVARGYRIGFKKTDSSSNAVTVSADGTEQIDGGASAILKKQFDFVILINDGVNWFVIGEYGSKEEDALPPDYINGFFTEQDSGDVDHDISIGRGSCRATGGGLNIVLSSGTIVKRIDANWVAGTGNGGFPSGLSLTADTWYHIFVIGKADGTFDSGFDSDIAAVNLLADAIGYTGYRRVASILTDATSNITKYYQAVHDANIFYWDVPVQDVNTTNPGAITVTATLTVPPDVPVYVILAVRLTHPALAIATLSLSPTSTTVLNAAAFLYSPGATVETAQIHLLTDISKQINYALSYSDGSLNVQVHTMGWIDPRGKR